MNRKPLPGFEGHYEVSDEGTVYRIARGKGGEVGPLKPYLSRGGYLTVSPSKNDRRRHIDVHRAVAEAFLGPANGLEVNHKNGIKTDNRLENLEYVTRQGNVDHASSAGLFQRGTSRWNSKLDENKVRKIRDMYATRRWLQRELAAMFGVDAASVNDIVNDRTWRWVS